MNDHLKSFANHSAYAAVENLLLKPNVSYCVQENEVHYNPYVHDYADDYFTFVALEDGTFTFTPKNSNIISYSTDDGETWTKGNSVEVNSGDKVLWKGTMRPDTSSYSGGIGKFSATGNFDVQGNVMSLLFGDNYKGQTDLTGKNYTFYTLFGNNKKVVNAENLSLPATKLVDGCYQNMFESCTSLVNTPELHAKTLATLCYNYMFYGCTNLTTAPELLATTLARGCYSGMFYNCSKLNYIKAMFTTTPSASYTSNWVKNVSATGTFVKNSAATWTTTGVDGIPTDWTVETASE